MTETGNAQLSTVAVPPVATVAWRPVLLLASGVAVLLGVTSAGYGYFGDELYFVAAGHRLAWGYADQPPLLPLLAGALDTLAPGNLVVLRLPVTLASAANVVLAGLIAAQLGGRRRAQVTAAAATAICPYLLGTGHLLATSTLDPLWWSVLLWLLVRWARTHHDRRPDDRLLLAAGVVLALALATKFLVLGLVAGVGIGVIAVGPRRLLTRPLLWCGLAVAAASTVPTLWWQAANGWPQLAMGDAVAAEAGLTGGRLAFLPLAVFLAGLVPGVVLAAAGLWSLLRLPALAPWRFAGVAVLPTTAAMIVAGGRPYYVAGFYVLLFAAGAVAIQVRTGGRPAPGWWSWTQSPSCFAVSGLLIVLVTLPIGPPDWRRGDLQAMAQVGWDSLADGVAATAGSLPPPQRDGLVVLAASYWYASALDRPGLPPVYSGSRGFGFLGTPPGSAPALLVGEVPGTEAMCRELRPLPAHLDPDAHPDVNGDVPMALCLPSAPWPQMWPSVQREMF